MSQADCIFWVFGFLMGAGIFFSLGWIAAASRWDAALKRSQGREILLIAGWELTVDTCPKCKGMDKDCPCCIGVGLLWKDEKGDVSGDAAGGVRRIIELKLLPFASFLSQFFNQTGGK